MASKTRTWNERKLFLGPIAGEDKARNWICKCFKMLLQPNTCSEHSSYSMPNILELTPLFWIQVCWMTDVGPDLSPTSYISTHFKARSPKLCKWLRLGLGPFGPRTKMADPRMTQSPSSEWLKPAQCWNPIWIQWLFIIMSCNGPPMIWPAHLDPMTFHDHELQWSTNDMVEVGLNHLQEETWAHAASDCFINVHMRKQMIMIMAR